MRRNRGWRTGSPLVVALMLAVALTGCSAADGLGSDARAAAAARNRAGELRKSKAVASADAVYAPLDSKGRTLTLALTIRKKEGAAVWAKVTKAALEGMDGPAFSGVAASATFTSPDGASIAVSSANQATLPSVRAEISQWRELEGVAHTPLRLELGTSTGSTYGYPRTYVVPGGNASAVETVLRHWSQIAAVPGAISKTSAWSGPGFIFAGASPPPSVVSLALASLSLLPPLNHARTQNDRVAVSWGGVAAHVEIFNSSSDRPTAISRVAARVIALAAAAPRTSAATWEGISHSGSLVLEGCVPGFKLYRTADDEALLAAVRSAGNPLPNMLAGTCQKRGGYRAAGSPPGA